ncbi:PAS domain S-box protein [candidate division KSB1 bacterium]|nr:PAS domain S-box protein [candidate division KSB1 bacterium]
MNDKNKTNDRLNDKIKELHKKIGELEKQNQQYEQINNDQIENEKTFRSFFEKAPLGYQSLDKNGNILIVNNAWLETLEYSAKDVIGHWFGDFLTKTDVALFEKYFPEFIKSGTIENVEFEMIKKNGTRIFVSFNGTANFDKAGKFRHSHCILQDITERKSAKAEIKRRDAILEALSIASENFLRTPSLDYYGIQKIIERLGLATEVSRVYVFENNPGKNNILLTSQRYEWVAPGIPSQMDNPHLHNFPYKAGGMGRWEENLKDNKIIIRHIKDFPASEKEILGSQSIQSILAVPIRVEGKWWGFIGFDHCKVEHEWFPAEIEAIRTAAAILGAMLERKKAEEEFKRSEESLRNLAARLEKIREEERTSIAREIHDDLGQSLTALKMDIAWLENKLPIKQDNITSKLKSMKELTDSIIQTVKKISTELRPGLLDDLGLVPAIEWQTEEFKKRTGINCNLDIVDQDLIIDKNLSTTVFRIFQESLTNISRHAKATEVYISFKGQNKKIVLSIRDNGIGISDKQISDPKSLGLLGIRERLVPFNGQFNIIGKKNKGTTVTVTIPIK